MSIDGWMDKDNMVKNSVQLLKKNFFKREILPYATTWIKFEDKTLSEISHSQKDKYCLISLV